MVNENELIEHFKNWYNDNKTDFDDDIDIVELIDKYTEYDYQFDINNEKQQHNHLDKINISLTQYEYHNAINFMIDYYGLTFKDIKPDNALNYYMLYMCNEYSYFSNKLDDIIDADDDDDVVVRDERHLKIPSDADGCFDKDFLKKKYDEIFDKRKKYGNPKKYSMKKLYDEYGIYCFYLDKDFMYSLNKPYFNRYNQFCFDTTEYDEKECEYIF